MATVTVSHRVNAPSQKVWEAWDDFANINAFNPNTNASFLINDSTSTGLGAERQCNFSDGKNHVKERVTGYEPGRRMVIDIYESTMPLKTATATVTLAPLGDATTRVTMQMDFQPGMGILGRLMIPMMKPKFAGMLGDLLKSNAAFVEKRAHMRAVA